MAKQKLINKDLDLLKRERRALRAICSQLDQKEIPLNNKAWSPRFEVFCKLLAIGQRNPVNIDVIKAAVELYSYNDRVALALLTPVAEEDYKELIKAVKRAGR